MFFGALLSAILSTASGALLAPTALFTENVMKPLFGEMSDKRFLLMLRIVLVLFTAGVLVFALNNTSTMYEMVQNAYKVTLVGAFVPLVCGIYWKPRHHPGRLLSRARRAGGVDDLRGVLRRRRGAAADRGPRGLGDRHGGRVRSPAADPGRPRHPGRAEGPVPRRFVPAFPHFVALPSCGQGALPKCVHVQHEHHAGEGRKWLTFDFSTSAQQSSVAAG
jgi:hypothetical protein